jgi:hypothetical protein
MAYTFDSLGYAKRLRDRVPQDQAEAHAEAARDFIMAELVTKTDLLPIKADLSALKADLGKVKQDLQTEIVFLKQALETKIETQSLRLRVRLGAMIVVGIGALATIMKLAQ